MQKRKLKIIIIDDSPTDTEIAQEALAKDLPCGAFTIEKEWIDIGNRNELRKANEGV